MFVNSLFERLDTVTLYFSYHSVWESVPYPNRRMKEGSVQCWCFSMRHGHSMIRHGWAGTSCSAGCVWIWQQCLEISRTVTGVHFIKHCDSSYFPSVLEASDGQFPTGSNFKSMMIAYAHGAHDYPGYPGQSAESNAMLEDSMTSVKTFYLNSNCNDISLSHQLLLMQVTVDDIDGDGAVEMIVIQTTGDVTCLSNHGNKKWSSKISGSSFPGSRLADVDGNGALDVVIPSDDGYFQHDFINQSANFLNSYHIL